MSSDFRSQDSLAAAPPGGSASYPPQPLDSSIPVWGLFGRCLLFLIGMLLIVPSPWTSTSFYKWLCERVTLPEGERINFTGKPGDIWYVFIGSSIATWISALSKGSITIDIVTYLLSALFGFLVIKWIYVNIKSTDGGVNLWFEGSFWGYLGWSLLLVVSIVTIIGWAWVLKFMIRWICRNVRGSARLDFIATGLSVLWRSLVFLILCALVIPIPWALRWYARWYISQISAVDV
jgi:hypothetical protein